MKSKNKCFLTITILLMLCIIFVGCKATPQNGKSAYEIAVENGFVGTETEWLASLVGANGKDGTNGKDGLDGKNGIDGKDGTSVTLGEQVSATTISNSLVSSVILFAKFNNGGTQETTNQGGGGVIIEGGDKQEGDAYIISCYHTFYKATNGETGLCDGIDVYLYGGIEPISATLIGGDAERDVAVLKIDNSEQYRDSVCVPAKITNSDQVAVGQTAIAVGNPAMEGMSLTLGTVSVDSEYLLVHSGVLGKDVERRVMRIDTPINSGNSGGGVFNSKGELIGIVEAKIESYAVDNVAYVLPSNPVMAIARNIIHNDGKYVHRKLGVMLIAKESKCVLSKETGYVHIEQVIRVDEVIANGKSDGILQVDDIITHLTIGEQTMPITRIFQCSEFLMDFDTINNNSNYVTISVLRNNSTLSFDIPME